MPTIAVIGAGVVGASIAFRLVEQGARVWLIDQAQPGGGTTSNSFAWANSNQKTPRDYFLLNYEGLREHYRLRHELGKAPWLHDGGNLIWEEAPDQIAALEQRVERLLDWGYAAEWRAATRVHVELEPRIAFPRPDLPVAFFPEEAWVDAPLLARSLVERAADQDAELRTATSVEAIETAGGRVSALRLARDERIEIDGLVNAAGPGADRVAQLVGLPLPLTPTRGLLVRLNAGDDPLSRIMHAPNVNIRPDGTGHVLVHHDSIDAQLGDRPSIDPSDPLCAELLARAQIAVPSLEQAAIESARIGVRPYPADGRSCVGAVSALAGYYEAVTHSGVTLGPLLGRLLTKEILSGEVDPLIAPFRPDRFSRN